MSLFDHLWVKPSKDEGVMVPINRFEAIDLLIKIQRLLNEEKYGEAMMAIGMDDSVFPEGQTLEEIFQAFQVRLSDLAKQAGVVLGEEK